MTVRGLMPARLVSFLGVGAIATALQYAILVFSVEALGLKPVVGSSVGFAISAVCNYWLNYHFTFRSRQSHAGAAARFALVAAAGKPKWNWAAPAALTSPPHRFVPGMSDMVMGVPSTVLSPFDAG